MRRDDEIKYLKALKDEDIDTSDIPEITDFDDEFENIDLGEAIQKSGIKHVIRGKKNKDPTSIFKITISVMTS